MFIGPLDVRILDALSSEPLATIQRLAHLSKISPHTCKRRLSTLLERRIFLRVAARVNLAGVDLESIPVLASVPPSQLAFAEKACDLHAYTRYRTRCFGSTNGLFILFGIPRGTEFQLIKFFDGLRSRGVVNDYQISSLIADPAYHEQKLSAYDPQTDNWHFDWARWSQLLDSEPRKEPLRKPSESLLSKLDMRDLGILRLLTMDARKEGKLIAKELGVPEYHVSRRTKFISENHLVSGYEVHVGRRLYRFSPAALLKCSCTLEVTRKIAWAITDLPFQSSLFPTREGFILYVGLPTPGFTEMANVILRHCEKVELMWTDYDTSMRYFFDDSPFLPDKNQWNTEERFLVEEPLAKLPT